MSSRGPVPRRARSPTLDRAPNRSHGYVAGAGGICLPGPGRVRDAASRDIAHTERSLLVMGAEER